MQKKRTKREAIADIRLLASQVESGAYVPPKFQTGEFTEKARRTYVAYLRREADKLEAKLSTEAKRTHGS